MSTFICEVVRIKGYEKHPGADTLNITEINGFPVIFKAGSFDVGDLAVYIPEGAMVPIARPEFAFLDKGTIGRNYERIKAIRLRGIYSEGLLVPADPNWQEGYDAKEELGVYKYEDTAPASFTAGDTESDPGFMPVYDLEPYQKNRKMFVEGERVILTEKLHGTNSRFGVDPADNVFYVGSHRTLKRFSEASVYWQVAMKLGIGDKLAKHPGIVLYGEIFGWVQDLKYGAKPGETFFRAFDVYDANKRRFFDYDDFVAFCAELGVDRVPVLYDGAYADLESLEGLRKGKSTISDAAHMREGFVIKPAIERYIDWRGEAVGMGSNAGRVAFKYVSEEYKLRKGGTELH